MRQRLRFGVCVLACIGLSMMGLVSFAAGGKVSPEVAQLVLKWLEDAERNPELALERLAGLAGRTRSDADFAFVTTERASLLIQQDRMAEAGVELAAALRDRPPEFAPRLRSLYATTLLADGRNAEALAQLEYWRAGVEEPHPGGLFLLGFAYVQEERFEDGIAVLEGIVDAGARDQWLEVLAYAYARAGRPADAVALLERLIAKRPARTRWWRQLAGVYMLLEDLQAGTASLAVSGLLDPLSLADARRLARLLTHLGLPADGARLLTRALDASEEPRRYEDQMLLGELWLLARESGLAIATFEAALPLAEGGEPALMIGRLHASREEYEKAGAALREAVRAYGENVPADAYYLLAVTEINLGNLAAARDAVERLAGYEGFGDRRERLAAYIRAKSG